MACVLLAAALVAFPSAATGAKKPTAKEIAKKLAAIDAEIRDAGRAFDKARWRVEDTDVRIRRVDAQLSKTADELAQAEKVFGERVGSIYKNDRLVYLEILLSAETIDEMVTRLDYLRRVSEEDARAVANVKTLRRKLASQRSTLSLERRDRAKEAAELKARRDAIVSRLRGKRAEYAKLKKQLDAAMAREKAEGKVTYKIKVARGGMIFPVAGACYFSDTWGASRSGGRRRHKGTDIMAARGTPCVACVSGTVTSKSSSLGGKTIWLTSSNGTKYYYAHLDRYVVRSGRVKAGQLIAYVGSTGNAVASAPHLHFEIHPGGGGAVNPYPYLRAAR